jgi:hypothetical protein
MAIATDALTEDPFATKRNPNVQTVVVIGLPVDTTVKKPRSVNPMSKMTGHRSRRRKKKSPRNHQNRAEHARWRNRHVIKDFHLATNVKGKA